MSSSSFYDKGLSHFATVRGRPKSEETASVLGHMSPSSAHPTPSLYDIDIDEQGAKGRSSRARGAGTERPDQARIHELWLRDPAGDDGLPALVHRDREAPGTLRTHRPAAPS